MTQDEATPRPTAPVELPSYQAQIAVLEGDPTNPEPCLWCVLSRRLPSKFQRMGTQPTNTVTVLQGTIVLADGEEYSESAGTMGLFNRS